MLTHPDRRQGQALLEFAVIALVLYLLLAATLELGRATFSVQTIQAAADLAAREISRTPLPPAATFDEALNSEIVRERIFDERLLVIELSEEYDLDEMFKQFPVVNQQFRTLMIIDRSTPGRTFLRYPGAIVNKGDETGIKPDGEDFQLRYGFSDSGFRIQIPVVSYGTDGSGTITWRGVMEEIPTEGGAFSVASNGRGMVKVRVNYPFQAASLVNFRIDRDNRFAPNGANAIIANDDTITASALPNGRTLANLTQDTNPNRQLQPNSGRFGLGSLLAGVPNKGGQSVRPFRRLLMGQGIYRREVFAP